jgi:queuine tRNA-ribosyltransferase
MFKVIKTSKKSKARIGKLKTLHGTVETPFFMPIATKGAVKNLSPDELKEIGASVVLSNTFHLMIKPGLAVLRKAGGLHKLMGWGGPILTDSGGYQVFSLSGQRKITDEGVEFRSPLDGQKIFLSPEESIMAQKIIGSDIIMVLDECPAFSNDKKVIEKAVKRTDLWAKRSKHFFQKNFRRKKPLLFGIVQGGVYKELREQSARGLVELDFDGYAIGGLCLGEPDNKTKQVLTWLSNLLPVDKPRYQMGAGLPEQIVEAVKLGMDMFDCVVPTRNARHGELFVFKNNHKLQGNFYEVVKINKAQYQMDLSPLDKKCPCYTCKHFSRAYLYHLFRVGEPLYQRLASLHNLRFYFDLMAKIKDGIRQGQI